MNEKESPSNVGVPLALLAVSTLFIWLGYGQRSIDLTTGATLLASPAASMASLTLTSSAFREDGRIPSDYTCDGNRSLNPPLTLSGVPEGTESLVLIIDDSDVPKALKPDGVFDHWVVFNMPLDTKEIPAGGPVPGSEGTNGTGGVGYTGPCPPTNYEPTEHRYIFTLYALDNTLALEAGANKEDVLQALQGHILEQAELVGRYSKQ